MIEWMTDTLAMTGLLMALVLVARGPVGRWFGPGAAYALWSLPMIRLVLPPLTLPRGLLPHYQVGVAQVTASAQVPVDVVVPAVTAGSSASTAVPALTVTSEQLAHIAWEPLLLALWLGGAALFLAWRVLGYHAMRRTLLRDGRQVARAGNVRIVETPAASAPLAFGVADKVIALPAGFLATVDSKTSDLAIAHELEHHAGSDLLALFAMQPLFALHWFNPIGWSAWRALRSDQEAACDARVMAACKGRDKARYGELIASFAGSHGLALIAPMAGPLMGDKPIIHRLKALARKDVGPVRRVLGRSLFAFAVVAVPATATVSYAAMDETNSAESPPTPAAPPAPVTPVADVTGIAVPQPPVAPQPPAPPRAIAPEARVKVEKQQLRAANAQREAGEAQRRAAVAERSADEALRMAAEALARAPRVEESITGDGKKVIRIIRKAANGQQDIVREMVLDDSCPADSHRQTDHTMHSSVVICTGEPKVAMTAAIDGLKSARASIASNRDMDAKVRAEILADMDKQIAESTPKAAN